MKSTANT